MAPKRLFTFLSLLLLQFPLISFAQTSPIPSVLIEPIQPLITPGSLQTAPTGSIPLLSSRFRLEGDLFDDCISIADQRYFGKLYEVKQKPGYEKIEFDEITPNLELSGEGDRFFQKTTCYFGDDPNMPQPPFGARVGGGMIVTGDEGDPESFTRKGIACVEIPDIYFLATCELEVLF